MIFIFFSIFLYKRLIISLLGNEISLTNKKDSKGLEKSLLLTDIACNTDETNKVFTLKPPGSSIGTNEEVFFIVRTIKTPENQPKVYI